MIVADSFGIAARGFSGNFENALARFTNRVDNRPDLLPVCQPAGNGLVVCRDVVRGPGRRETYRSGIDRLFNDGLHLPDFVFRGFVRKSPFAHNISTQSRMTDVTCIVDTLGLFIYCVEKLGKGLPAPFNPRQHRVPGYIFSALQASENKISLFLPAGSKCKATVAHDCGCDTVVTGA